MNDLVGTMTKIMYVFQLMEAGYTVTRACEKAQTTWATVKKHIDQSVELQEMYTNAEQRGIDTLADVLLDIEGHAIYGTTDKDKQKIRSDNIKWYISRKRPKQYGDRVVVENTITMDRVVLDALERGKQRALAGGPVVEAIVHRVSEDVVEAVVEDEFDPSEFI